MSNTSIVERLDLSKTKTPHGTTLSCKGWQQEAALRMLLNNLDPDVAERQRQHLDHSERHVDFDRRLIAVAHDNSYSGLAFVADADRCHADAQAQAYSITLIVFLNILIEQNYNHLYQQFLFV